MPHLVQVHENYRDRDVTFIGLTSETPAAEPHIRQVLERAGATWHNGYGAIETLVAFDVELIPVTWVIGPDNRIVWTTDDGGTLEDGIERALAQAGR